MLSTLRNNSNYDFGKYLCPKCSQILREAVQTSCGHWLCQLCADEIFRDDPVPKCLHADCNELLTEENKFLYFPDRFVRKEVNKIPVECPSTQHGCTWTGRYGEMKSHIQECSFARTACLYCNQWIPTQQMSMHKKICQMRVEQCPFVKLGCKQEDKMSPTTLKQHLTDDLVVHLKIVAEYLLKIVGHHDVKTEKITDDGIASTDSSLSLLSLSKMATLVERDGSGDNSIAPYRGREEDNLVPTYLERNFQLLAKGANYKAELDALRANLHTKDSYISSLQQSIAMLEKQVQAASSQSEDRDFRLSLIENINYDGSMIWKIPQFSQRMEDARSGKYTSIFSLPFYSGRYGYKMCLRLYILGDGIGKNTHMSLFFVMMKGEFDAILQWPFTHKVSFRLINQHHGRDIVDVFQPDPLSSSFQRPKTDMNVASGCPRFISLAELNQGGFIEDNTIFIKVKVDVSTIKHP